MTTPVVVPLSDINRRAPEAGRIRIGRKVKTSSGKEAPSKIETFRFTSPHKILIDQLANMYGGTVEAWNEPKARIKGQWQVMTTSKKIRVYLPADGISQNYEKWTGGGCERRCDGVTVQTTRTVGDAVEVIDSPCICIVKGKRECEPYTRLTVILPELPFYGTWRLESKGKNARDELPGMFDLIVSLQARSNMAMAMLSVEARSEVREGKTRNFVVPVLTVEQSPLEILAGQADVRSISAAGEGQTALPAASSASRPADVDEDGVIVGEIVDPDDLELRAKLVQDGEHFGLDAELFADLVMASGNGWIIHADMIAGRVEPQSISGGKVKWKHIKEQETT